MLPRSNEPTEPCCTTVSLSALYITVLKLSCDGKYLRTSTKGKSNNCHVIIQLHEQKQYNENH